MRQRLSHVRSTCISVEPQLTQCLVQIVALDWLSMPAQLVFKKRHPFSLEGLRNKDRRLIFGRMGLIECRQHLF